MFAVCNELLSTCKFPDPRENTGNFIEFRGPWRVPGPSNLNRLVAKFPTQQNREFNPENSEFFLRNREAYADKSEDDDGVSDGGADT